MNMNDPRVREFARLQVTVGAGLRPGKRLYLKGVPLSAADYIRVLAEEAYAVGASDVQVSWVDGRLDRLRYLHAADAELDRHFGPAREFFESLVAEGDSVIHMFSQEPHSTDGCDARRIGRAMAAYMQTTAPLREAQMKAAVLHCTSTVPNPAWAREVFPQLAEAEALDRLWEAVLAASRVTGDGRAAERWQEFDRKSKARAKKLSEARLTELRYRSGLGMDLTVGLPEGVLWESASSEANGQSYYANLPTEEIFTSPHRERAEGVIVSSMPLYWQGAVIRGIRLVMHDGVVTEAHADEGLEALLEVVEHDEGSRRLGECALVGWDSPIRAVGVNFCNALFDENAACHFALGKGFDYLVPGDARAAGINESDKHMDFMVGTADLSVTGVRADGGELPIMRDGMFVI